MRVFVDIDRGYPSFFVHAIAMILFMKDTVTCREQSDCKLDSLISCAV